jgi:hypothetical protein
MGAAKQLVQQLVFPSLVEDPPLAGREGLTPEADLRQRGGLFEELRRLVDPP